MYAVDINCDLGESFGNYSFGNDEALMKYISSANIACGFHAGDPAIMQQTVALAVKENLAIGAHPGLPDLAGFGRRYMAISPAEAYQITLYQVGALAAFAKAAGTKLNHVKAHGALYNMAAENDAIAHAIANAVADFDQRLVFYGLSGSRMIKAAQKLRLATASEVFADRSYQGNGTLTPRSDPKALITDPDLCLEQVISLVRDNCVTTTENTKIKLQADTICVHGDHPHSLQFVKLIRQGLEAAGIAVKSIKSS
jgi:UPF0271 protein